MPPVQTTYSERQRVAYAGLVVNMETANSISRIVEDVAGVGFGLPVFQGVGDKGVLSPGGVVFAAAAAAVAGNVGNGTITAVPVVGVGAQEGRYKLMNIGVAANAGTFEMTDPDGKVLGAVKVGVAATLGGVGPFTIADGATDFAEGDSFNIDVTTTTGGTAFRGVTIGDKTLVAKPGQTVDVYQKGDTAGLLTDGVIWVIAGGAVHAGEQAYYNPATSRFVEAAGVALPNCSFDTSGADGGLVQLRVSHL
jgi:hypothetical protein